MEQKYILGVIILMIVAALGIGIISAFNIENRFFSGQMSQENKTVIKQEMKAIQEAITNKNYTAWKSLMEQRITRIQSQITEDNFNKIVESYKNLSQFKTELSSLREKYRFSRIKMGRNHHNAGMNNSSN